MTIIPYLLLTALVQVESGGNDHAKGDYVRGEPTSYGCLQIGDKVLADVRRISGVWVSRSDAFNRRKSCEICVTYLSHYATRERLGHDPSIEDFARIWHRGPDGWRDPSAVEYARRVNRLYLSLSRLPAGSDPIHGDRPVAKAIGNLVFFTKPEGYIESPATKELTLEQLLPRGDSQARQSFFSSPGFTGSTPPYPALGASRGR